MIENAATSTTVLDMQKVFVMLAALITEELKIKGGFKK